MIKLQQELDINPLLGMAIGNLIRVVITLIRIKRLKVQSDV
jgi:hypothetical protein